MIELNAIFVVPDLLPIDGERWTLEGPDRRRLAHDVSGNVRVAEPEASPAGVKSPS